MSVMYIYEIERNLQDINMKLGTDIHLLILWPTGYRKCTFIKQINLYEFFNEPGGPFFDRELGRSY